MEEKPEIKEDEITPDSPPPTTPPSSSSPTSSTTNDGQAGEGSPNAADGHNSQGQSSSSKSSSQETDEDVREVAKKQILEIYNKSRVWIIDAGSLATAHESTNRLQNLTITLDALLEKIKQEAASASPSSSS